MLVSLFSNKWCDCKFNTSHIWIPTGDDDADVMARRTRYALRKNVAYLSVKRKIMEKHDMIPLIVDELVNTFGLDKVIDIKTYKQKIKLLIPCYEVDLVVYQAFAQKLKAHVELCMNTKWAHLVVLEKNTLQSLIMESLMNKPEFKFAASIHFAEKHGATQTFDVMDLVRDWSLRY